MWRSWRSGRRWNRVRVPGPSLHLCMSCSDLTRKRGCQNSSPWNGHWGTCPINQNWRNYVSCSRFWILRIFKNLPVLSYTQRFPKLSMSLGVKENTYSLRDKKINLIVSYREIVNLVVSLWNLTDMCLDSTAVETLVKFKSDRPLTYISRLRNFARSYDKPFCS